MKKSYIFGFVLFIIIVGLVWAFVSGKFEGNRVEDSVVESRGATPITLTTIRADVMALRGVDKVSTTVESTTTLSVKDSVKTGPVGRALLENADFKSVVDRDTELSIADVASERARLELNSGSVWLRVEKIFGKGEGVEVETPNAVAAVRGTSFGVSYSNGVTTLWVTSGTVAFWPKGHPEDEVLVPAGSKAVIGPDGKVKVSLIDSADKNTEWFKYNDSDTASGNQNAGSSNTSNGSGGASGALNAANSSTTITTPPPTNTSPNSPNTHSGGGGSHAVGTTTIIVSPSQQTPPSGTIHISSINPTKIAPNQRAEMNIYGNGFQTTTTVMVGKTKLDFSVISDTHIFTVIAELAPGTYEVMVAGPHSSDTLPRALTVSLQ